MESYSDFADVYDELMDEVPYELWRDRIVRAIKEYGISKTVRDKKISEEKLENRSELESRNELGDGDELANIESPVSEEELLASERNLVVDLGCGTGTLTELLYEAGYDMIGIDYSEAMLEKAFEKREETGSEILYLNQDMRELELYSTVGTVVSVCDSLNYILDEQELTDTFSLVHNYLYPNGLFIFDFNTDYKYREVIGDSTIAENREDCSFIWENFYDEDTQINQYDLTIFIKDEISDEGLFRRIEETHLQRGYEISTIQSMLIQTGFEIVQIVDGDSEEEVAEETQRIFIVARCIK